MSLHIQNNHNSFKLWVKLNCDLKEALKVFILQKYGCNERLILLGHFHVSFILYYTNNNNNCYYYHYCHYYIIVMRLRVFNTHITRNTRNTRISIYRKVASSLGRVAFLILHNNKQSPHHPTLEELCINCINLGKSLNISLVKSSTISFN